MDWLIIAQAADPVTGASGWAGAGLLGLVLAALIFYILPAKDRQLKEMIEAFNGEMAKGRADYIGELGASRKDYVAALTDQRKEFKETLAQILARCDRELDLLGGIMRHNTESLGKSLDTLSLIVEAYHREGKP